MASAPGGSELWAQRDAPVGGQAVLEGVMMRGAGAWAVAVRKPLPEQLADGGLPRREAARGEIEVRSFPLRSVLGRHRLLGLPVLRGVVALGESLAIGLEALAVSTNAQMRDEQDAITGPMRAGTLVVVLALAIGLFFVVPVALTSLITDQLGSPLPFWLVEGGLRMAIFLGYVAALSRMRDLRRVLQYHGAEHKTIACHEAGLELTPENAQRFSRLHPRCGTSFLLIVMVVAVVLLAPIGVPDWPWLVLSRVLGVPVIAGVSFEVIKFAGRNRRRRWVGAAMWPGLMLQKLTTREPDRDQLAVAIAALTAVLTVRPPGERRADDTAGAEVVA